MVIGKDILGILSVALCCIQYVPLIYLTLRGKKRPHVLTRLIWALTLGITFAAQWLDRGGAGSWSNGFSALCCVAIAAAALRSGKAYITRSDWIAFAAALFAIPLWVLTKNPLAAVMWAALIDVIGYFPTFRKAWHHPYEEMASVFILGCIKSALGICALENYTLTTLIYPVATLAADITFIVLLAGRRRIMGSNNS